MKNLKDWIKIEFEACWKFWSLRFGFVLSSFMAMIALWPEALLTTWASLPAEFKTMLPPNVVTIVTFTIVVLSALNRVIKQRAVEREKRIIEASKTSE